LYPIALIQITCEMPINTKQPKQSKRQRVNDACRLHCSHKKSWHCQKETEYKHPFINRSHLEDVSNGQRLPLAYSREIVMTYLSA
jgi:hypothetical protein